MTTVDLCYFGHGPNAGLTGILLHDSGVLMILALAGVLLALWLLDLVVLPVTVFAIHLLLIAGGAVVVHLPSGQRSSVSRSARPAPAGI